MNQKSSTSRAVAYWLFTCVVMVALMVWIGGMTRLSGSGLSMTDWHPIHGVIPPMSTQEWNEEFDAYQASPEYIKINYDMTLDGFKRIFYVEWFHRIMGRITGFVVFLPLAFFYFTKRLNNRATARLLGIFALGGLQGVVGWYMVKSGLVDNPNVSPYRLTLHLSMAFILGALLLREALLHRGFTPISPDVRRLSIVAATLVFMQIMAGGLVAGFDAGLAYNTYPLMDGELVPSALTSAQAGLFNSVVGVQFLHRMLAIIALLAVLTLAWQCWRKNEAQSAIILGGLIVIQFALGIKTLLFEVPMGLASAHQMVALALWLAVIWVVTRTRSVL